MRLNQNFHLEDDTTNGGSPGEGELLYLIVGQLRRPHGVRGEMKMAVLTDFPERLKVGKTVYLGSAHQPVTITNIRWQNDVMLISFQDYQNRKDVELLRNQWVYIIAGDLPSLEKGDFYHHELLGLQVVSDEGNLLGEIVEILETGANDVLVVESVDGGEILLPMIEDVLIDIKPESGQVTVHLLPGLLD